MSAAERLQQYGESVASAIALAEPPMTGGELEWAQQEVRDAQTDAAHLGGHS